MAMQGSGISGVDIASVEIRLNDDGFYTLLVGCTDMGTGCDTILAQMAAECLDCDVDRYCGAGRGYRPVPLRHRFLRFQSTTYVTGMAVCQDL